MQKGLNLIKQAIIFMLLAAFIITINNLLVDKFLSNKNSEQFPLLDIIDTLSTVAVFILLIGGVVQLMIGIIMIIIGKNSTPTISNNLLKQDEDTKINKNKILNNEEDELNQDIKEDTWRF